jgi:hypothetical protein
MQLVRYNFETASVEENYRYFRSREITKRTAATTRTATRTSDRTFCFFRSLSQSSVSFGFRQAFLALIKKGSKLFGENCLHSSAAVVRDGVPATLALENVRHPTGSRDPNVNVC